jgi:hypothetical protein
VRLKANSKNKRTRVPSDSARVYRLPRASMRRTGDDLARFGGSNVADFGGKIRRSPEYRGRNQRDDFQTVFARHEDDPSDREKLPAYRDRYLWLLFDHNEAIFPILGAEEDLSQVPTA